jgi:hypothetical protein
MGKLRKQNTRAAALEKRRKEMVEIAKLTGPTIKSHPWKKMLAGKKPEWYDRAEAAELLGLNGKK